MERYTTLTGEILKYEKPRPEVEDFLTRLRVAVNSPEISQSQISELIYGLENPITDKTIFKGRGAITKAVFLDPLYHIMLDLLDQKRIQAGTLDLQRALAQFTMSAPEAAKRLGLTPSGVRQAIQAKRLSGIKKGGRYFVDPRSVESYRVGRRLRLHEEQDP